MPNIAARIFFILAFSNLIFACVSSRPKNLEVKQDISSTKPDHVLVMIFDAMRPEFVDRFDLKNFKKFRVLSQNYQNAYLGYIGSVTVVSHLVLPAGKPPKDLPWQDDIYWDQKGLLGPAGAFYPTTGANGLSIEQLRHLMTITPIQDPLPAEIKSHFGGSVYAVGEKYFAATDLATLSADGFITMKKEDGRCITDGVNVPSYISSNDRFKLECSKKYGTENTLYPLDGAKYVPGDDPAHLGGDIWTADVALELMKNEKWSGLLLTFAAIDKVMHMLGEVDPHFTPAQLSNVKTEYHLKEIAQIADAQLGRILDQLEKDGLLNRTLLVVTADHGCQVDKHYLGNGKSYKWGEYKDGAPEESPFWMTHISKAGNIKFSYADTAIRTWLNSRDANPTKAIRAMSEVPGVTEIYALQNSGGAWSYKSVFSNFRKSSQQFKSWAKNHSKEILDATATEASPDLIALLADETGFGLLGDHGGAQEGVQRIPLMIYDPGVAGKVIQEPIRMYELKTQIAHDLGWIR